MDKNKLWYFSFGVDHPFGSFLLPIRGTFNAAREVMAEIFGYHWCDQYDDVEGLHLIEQYHYRLLPEISADWRDA